MQVFIDTNILLNFYQFTKEDIEALYNVFASHEYGAAEVHLTQQVSDEFFRNRENKIKDALKKFKDVKFAAQLPVFMKKYEEYEQIMQKSTELQELAKAILKKVDKDVVEGSLLADVLINDIFAKSSLIKTTQELFAKAQMRVALGNPPGKNESLGDSVNWIALLEAVHDGEDIHVISEDRDYYSTLDENRPHPCLKSEWNKKKNAQIFVYRSLTKFLKANFDGVAFSYDKKKDALIETLADSGSFSVTHNLIMKLEQFSYFSLKEVQRILAAAVSNNQFGWISTDDDVFAFLKRVAVPRIGLLTDNEQVDLLLKMLDAKATNENA